MILGNYFFLVRVLVFLFDFEMEWIMNFKGLFSIDILCFNGFDVIFKVLELMLFLGLFDVRR